MYVCMWIHRRASYRCILYMSLLYLFNPLKAFLSAAETPVEEKLGFKKQRDQPVGRQVGVAPSKLNWEDKSKIRGHPGPSKPG